MCGKITITVALIVLVAMLSEFGNANPIIDSLGGLDNLGVCVRNCAQCKKMYGAYFEGQMCAESCVKYRGKVIPDCEDVGSIAPFLNKLE